MLHLQRHRARFTRGSTALPTQAQPRHAHARSSYLASSTGWRSQAAAPASGLLHPSGQRPPPLGSSTSGSPQGAAAAALPGATSTAQLASPPEVWTDGDVLRLVLADGRTLHAEVVVPAGGPARTNASLQAPRGAAATGSGGSSAGGAASPQKVMLLCQGVRYTVRKQQAEGAAAAAAPAGDGGLQSEQAADGPALVLEVAGGALAPNDSLRALLETPPKRHALALRAWAPLAAPRLLRPLLQAQPPSPAAPQPQQQPQQSVDSASLNGARVVSVHRTGSVAELRQRAETEPGAWCDGSGPADPPASEDSRALYTAGELACLLEGRRGVVLLQLHVGWDAPDRVPPYGPYKPLVLRLLREALERPDIVSYASAAPVPGSAAAGNPSYGLTMVLCADKEPYRSWGAHLGSFGCQAALEAQSPYYKLLIGRVLGYRPDNIAHYIKEKHGQEPSREVVAAVEQQLTKLSPKRPNLPWTARSRGGGGGGGRKKVK